MTFKPQSLEKEIHEPSVTLSASQLLTSVNNAEQADGKL